MTASANEMQPLYTLVITPFASPLGPGQYRPPTHDAIACRAYDIYLKTGRVQGQCKENWQQAEQSLRDRCQLP